MRRVALAVVLAGTLAAAGPAHAAKNCAEPGAEWQRATPAEAGMDAAKLQDALDYGSSQASFAVRVYRHGCLVGEDREAPYNRTQTYESYSLAKSVTAMVFGRAMTLGQLSPADPVGSLVPEADKGHGNIILHDLLTMTSGLRWNGFRDYNVFTMRDRLRDALTLEVVKPRGTYFEYAQSAVSLLAEATARAIGEDFEDFAQRELMAHIGIDSANWNWVRDSQNHVLGFMGVNMRPDDFGRLGDLMRRGGVWKGRRLLSEEFMTKAITPSRTNGCYGWLIWLNSAAPCIGPTITSRPVSTKRDQPDLPGDLYRFSGLFGQLVAVFPTQDIVVVRTGQDPGLVNFSGGQGWEHDLYEKVLASVTDQTIEKPGEAPVVNDERESYDYGFQKSIREPDQYSKGGQQDELPPAGPGRARAVLIDVARETAGRLAAVRVTCPPRLGTGSCAGDLKLDGSRNALSYELAPGQSKVLRFALTPRRQRLLHKARSMTFGATALSRDPAGGTSSHDQLTFRRAS
jgi:CubicO group peptidase (beta-lactamase class C family)